MVTLKFNDDKKEWYEVPKGTEGGLIIDGFLRKKADNIKMIVKNGWDAVILIDGFERSGKSTLGMTLGWYLSDTKLTINNFASGLLDAAQKIKELPEGSVLIVDEGSLVFNSRDSMSKANIRLAKILDVVGQKHLTFIVILPSFFNLVKDIAVRRSRFLLHVYTDPETLKRGRFAYFGEKSKSILYTLGKKNFGSYANPQADFVGTFSDFKPPFYEEYIRLKTKSLEEALEVGEGKSEEKTTFADLPKHIKAKLVYDFSIRNQDSTMTSIAKAFGLHRGTIREYIQYIKEEEAKASSNQAPVMAV